MVPWTTHRPAGRWHSLDFVRATLHWLSVGLGASRTVEGATEVGRCLGSCLLSTGGLWVQAEGQMVQAMYQGVAAWDWYEGRNGHLPSRVWCGTSLCYSDFPSMGQTCTGGSGAVACEIFGHPLYQGCRGFGEPPAGCTKRHHAGGLVGCLSLVVTPRSSYRAGDLVENSGKTLVVWNMFFSIYWE